MIVRETGGNFWFIATGRIVWREDKIDAWNATGDGTAPENASITLHRYGVEFIHSVNPMVMQHIRETARECSPLCAGCGEKTESSRNQANGKQVLCVLCNLRAACQNLLNQDDLEGA